MRRHSSSLRGRPSLDIPMHQILETVRRRGRVAPAARELGCSAAYVWNRLKLAGLTLAEVLES